MEVLNPAAEPVSPVVMLRKQDLDLQLKNDSEKHRFSVDGDYLLFDKLSDLSYHLSPLVTLQMLLTKNPVSSFTRINKNLLVKFLNAVHDYGKAVDIVASYRSPEYALLAFGNDRRFEYTHGKALAVQFSNVADAGGFISTLEYHGFSDILLLSNYIVFFSLSAGSVVYKTEQADYKTKFFNLLISDKLKNMLLIGAAAVAGWFLFLRKK